MGRDRTTPFGFYNNKKVWGGARQVHGALGDSRDHTFNIVVGAVLQTGCAFFLPPRSASPPPLGIKSYKSYHHMSHTESVRLRLLVRFGY